MQLGIIDDLNGYLQGNLLPFFQKMPWWFPVVLVAIAIVAVVAILSVKTQMKMDESKSSELPEAEEYGDFLHSQVKGNEAPNTSQGQPNGGGGGGSDLEGRLIAALANAPWMVKNGSEIALSKRGNGEWGIETNKIVFALEPKKELAITVEPPEVPPPPESDEQDVKA